MVDNDPAFALPTKIVVAEAFAYAAVYLVAAERLYLIGGHDAGHVRLNIAALVYFVPLRAGDKVAVYGKRHHGDLQHTRQRSERVGQIRGAAVKRVARLGK